MRILSLNCRGLRRPSTIPQLKKAIRLNLSDMIFICETKQSTNFFYNSMQEFKIWKNMGYYETSWKKRVYVNFMD